MGYDDYPRYITTKSAAEEVFGLPESTIRDVVRKYGVPYIGGTGRWHIQKDALKCALRQEEKRGKKRVRKGKN